MFSRICAFDSSGHSILSNQKLALWSAVAIVHFGANSTPNCQQYLRKRKIFWNNLWAKIFQYFKRGDIKVNVARCWDGHAKSRGKILWLHFKVLPYVLTLKCDDLEYVNTYKGVSKGSGGNHFGSLFEEGHQDWRLLSCMWESFWGNLFHKLLKNVTAAINSLAVQRSQLRTKTWTHEMKLRIASKCKE